MANKRVRTKPSYLEFTATAGGQSYTVTGRGVVVDETLVAALVAAGVAVGVGTAVEDSPLPVTPPTSPITPEQLAAIADQVEEGLAATVAPASKPVAARAANSGKTMPSPPTVTVETASALTGPWSRTRVGGGGAGTAVDTTMPFLFVGVSANPLDAIAVHPTNTFPWYNSVVSTHKTVANTTSPTHVVRFISDADSFEVNVMGTGGNARVSIDGQWTAEQMLTVPAGERFLRVVGLDGKPHTISIELSNLAFAGVRVSAAGQSVVKPRLAGPTGILFGDSFTSGAQQTLMGYARRLGARLGIDNLIESGVGGTGYIAPGSAGNVKFIDRITNDIVNRQPSFVAVPGGRNDLGFSDSDVQAASAAFWTALRAALPDAFLVCIGPLFEFGQLGAATAKQAAIFAGAAGKADAFIDTCASPIFTGTGNTSAPSGSGNSDLYINGTDLPHPTLAGQNYLADWLASKVAPLIPAAAPVPPPAVTGVIPPSHASTVFLPSSLFKSNTGAPAESTKSISHAWLLDSASSEAVSTVIVPRDRMRAWGSFVADVIFTPATSGAGDVRFRFDVVEVAPDGGSLSSPGGTTLTATAPAANTTKAARPAATYPISSVDNLFYIRVFRLGADAADTLTEDAAFLGVRLTRAS